MRKDDMGEIIHYGHTEVCFDLHPKQVQPAHIVITSPYFRTDERKFGKYALPGRMNYDPLPEETQKIIFNLVKNKVSYAEIGRRLGITDGRVQYYYGKQKGWKRC